jgi:RNA recognition motif-containing protein
MDEVILFRIPRDDSNLIVFNLPLHTTEDELIKLFSSSGLIDSIMMREKELSADSYAAALNNNQQLLYAFIKYYSQYEAIVAKKLYNNYNYKGNKLKVQFVQRNKGNCPNEANSAHSSTQLDNSRALSFNRCVSVANYFLGYNAWSCRINEILAYDHEIHHNLSCSHDHASSELHSAENNYQYSYVATVQLIIKGNVDITSSAVYHGVDNNLSHIKKCAVTLAYKSLFHNLAIIRLKEGQSYVRAIE